MFLMQPIYDNCPPETIGETVEEAAGELLTVLSSQSNTPDTDEPALDDPIRKAWDAIGSANTGSQLIDAWNSYGTEYFDLNVYEV